MRTTPNYLCDLLEPICSQLPWIEKAMNYVDADPTIWFVAISILVFGVAYDQIAFAPKFRELKKALSAAHNQLVQHNSDWGSIQRNLTSTIDSYPILKDPWRETLSSITIVSISNKPTPVQLRSLDEIWWPRKILSSRLNISIYDSMPNILVGIGLLFTFLFLSIALTIATSGLFDGTSVGDTVKDLLGAVGAKFFTSLSGLASSLLWLVTAKRRLNYLDQVCQKIIREIDQSTSPIGTDLIFIEQLKVSTRIANKLDGMTEQLTNSIEKFSTKLGTINQDALVSMTNEFSIIIRETSASEAIAFRKGLNNLAIQLHNAVDQLGDGIEAASQSLQSAGIRLANEIDSASVALGESANSLSQATLDTKLTINDLDHTIAVAVDIAKAGNQEFKSTADMSHKIIQDINRAATDWKLTVTSVNQLSSQFQDLIEKLNSVSHDQQQTIAIARRAPEEALSMLREMSKSMQSSASEIASMMGTAEKALRSTNADFGNLTTLLNGSLTQVQENISNNLAKLEDLQKTMIFQASQLTRNNSRQ
jgi:hypothetical protein